MINLLIARSFDYNPLFDLLTVFRYLCKGNYALTLVMPNYNLPVFRHNGSQQHRFSKKVFLQLFRSRLAQLCEK